MSAEDRAAKREFIEAFFDDYSRRAARVRQIAQLEMPEEAITLACCYIDALSYLRFGEGQHRDKFVRFIREYSDYGPLMMRISLRHMKRNGRDRSLKGKGGTPLDRYADVLRVLTDACGGECNADREPTDTELIELLERNLGTIDRQHFAANLPKFSHAAVLYESYRSSGVHYGGMARRWSVETTRPIFPEGDSGEAVYYEDEILEFSLDFILGLFENVISRLRRECLDNLAFPGELG